jgi:predicted dehydrogenase
MSRLKVAVVGVGALGRHHARILSELDSVDLVAVADTHQERGTAVAEQHQTQWVPDYRLLFDQVDAVSIAVPTTAHLQVARPFLKRRIPVLVEKPLASDLAEAETLVALADEHDTILQVGHVERFNPATQAAWELCGPPKYIRAERLSPFSFRSTDIGVVLDLMIHDIDLVLDLVDAPIRGIEAFGIGVVGDHEDCVQARITFENGCIADLTASRINPAASRAMQIWSHTGCVNVDFAARQVVRYSPSETLLYGTSPVERANLPGADIEQLKQEMFGTFLRVHQALVPATDALTAELGSFVECVQTQTQPLVDGRQALRAMSVAHQVLESVAAHQWDGHADGAIGPFAQSPKRRKLAG